MGNGFYVLNYTLNPGMYGCLHGNWSLIRFLAEPRNQQLNDHMVASDRCCQRRYRVIDEEHQRDWMKINQRFYVYLVYELGSLVCLGFYF